MYKTQGVMTDPLQPVKCVISCENGRERRFSWSFLEFPRAWCRHFFLFSKINVNLSWKSSLIKVYAIEGETSNALPPEKLVEKKQWTQFFSKRCCVCVCLCQSRALAFQVLESCLSISDNLVDSVKWRFSCNNARPDRGTAYPSVRRSPAFSLPTLKAG